MARIFSSPAECIKSVLRDLKVFVDAEGGISTTEGDCG